VKKILPTLIALGLFISVFSYYQYFQKEKASEEAKENLIWQEDQNKITEINIIGENTSITIKRNGTTWDITSPIEYPANSYTIETMLSRFSSPKSNGFVEEEPEDLSVYGLNTPAKSITLTDDTGNSKTLSLGNTAPLGMGYYVLDKDTKKVYTMDASLWDEIDLEVNALRDKTLLSFSEEYVEKIEIKNKDTSFSITSKEDGILTRWYSGDKELDEVKVNTFLASLRGKVVKEFTVDNADEKTLEEYGLKHPRAVITLYLSDKEDSILTLYVGNTTEEDEDTYVALEDKKFIYKIQATSLLPAELTIDSFTTTEKTEN